ncbi:MAG TPA: hypothetical protein VE093_08980 [Polyangiaceae bacterium]|nr:hypothetical protein [Polyangiaceae bacterium]
MTTPRTLSHESPLTEVRSHLSYTVRRLRAHALTQFLAPTFEALLTQWTLLHQKELELADKVDDTVIEGGAIDGELNAFAHHTSRTLLDLTSNNRNHPLYLHFFGGKPLHVFTRPVLAGQLYAMRQWNPSLAQSGHASLTALGGALTPLIEKADEVVAARAAAEQAVRQFREIGERKQFIDEVNAARKEAHGVLSTLPHKHTALPARFADGFFKRDRPRDEAPDLEAIEGAIEKLKKELAEQEKAREELLAAQAAAKAAEEEQVKAAAEAKLAAIKKEIELKMKEAAAIQAVIQA